MSRRRDRNRQSGHRGFLDGDDILDIFFGVIGFIIGLFFDNDFKE